jgi:hypothetical protein
MKPFSGLFWVLLVAGVALVLLLLTVLNYREARAAKVVIAIVLASFLIWLKTRSRKNGQP